MQIGPLDNLDAENCVYLIQTYPYWGNIVQFISWYWIYSANNWGIYVSWIYMLVSDIFCQQLRNKCKLNLYIGIGYILPTIEGYISIKGCLCAHVFLENPHSPALRPKGAQTPHNWHISPNCWQNIPNTRIYLLIVGYV